MFQIIFSDESTIAVLDDRVHTVCRRPQCLKKTVKFPAKIIVLGAIAVYEASRLHIVKRTMNTSRIHTSAKRTTVTTIKRVISWQRLHLSA